MKRADLIREYVFINYIEPARKSGKGEVVIRAGDVHSEMKLRDSMPAIVSAIGSNKFLSLANVELLQREGRKMEPISFLLLEY